MTVTKPRTESWNRSEARIIRPFRTADDALEGCALRLTDEMDFQESETLETEGVRFEALAPAIRLDRDLVEVALGLELRPDELELVIIAEDNVLKQSTVLFRRAVSDLEPGEVQRVEDVDGLRRFGWKTETQVTVSLVLSQDRRPEGLRARRAGNWLAKKVFKVKAEKHVSNFATIVIQPSEFPSRFNLPEATSYFVDVLGDLRDPIAEVESVVKVYVNAKVAQTLAAEHSAVAKALAVMLFAEIVTTVLATGFAPGSQLDDEPAPDSILGAITQRISKATGVSPGTIAAYGREAGAAQLRALVQAATDMTKALASPALKR
jgi:hypothetical protein